jgi:hypothetical protein
MVEQRAEPTRVKMTAMRSSIMAGLLAGWSERRVRERTGGRRVPAT